MLQPLRLLLQVDDVLLEPLDLPLQRRPLRLFALELKVVWKFMISVVGRKNQKEQRSASDKRSVVPLLKREARHDRTNGQREERQRKERNL